MHSKPIRLSASRRSRGAGKGAKDVGLSANSRPKFKRNSRKFKSKFRGKGAASKEKGAPVAVDPDISGGEPEKVGTKRPRRRELGQQGDKKFKCRWMTPLSWEIARECVCVCAVLVRKAKEKQPLTRKERRELKKRKRKNHDLISETLHLWEKLRR